MPTPLLSATAYYRSRYWRRALVPGVRYSSAPGRSVHEDPGACAVTPAVPGLSQGRSPATALQPVE